MNITNKFGLPDTIVNVLARPTYSKGKAHISVTELINSPRIVQLKRQHWDQIEEDASSMVWSLFGSAVHNILEHGKQENHIVEERIHLTHDGWNLSGAIDLQTASGQFVQVYCFKRLLEKIKNHEAACDMIIMNMKNIIRTSILFFQFFFN